MRRSLTMSLLAIFFFAYAVPGAAATLTVTTTADVINPSDGVLSLREAVEDAVDGDVIVFDRSLLPATFQLTLGDLEIPAKNLTIEGYGAEQVAIVGRVLTVLAGQSGISTLTLQNLTVSGGGIRSDWVNLTLIDCIVENSATDGVYLQSGRVGRIINSVVRNSLGSGIRGAFIQFDVTAINSIIENNARDGIESATEGGTISVVGTTIRNNGRAGIALSRRGPLDVIDSSVQNNGGVGILVGTQTTTRVVNSFIGYNAGGISAGAGGVVVDIDNSVVQGNSSERGGGLIGSQAEFNIRGSHIVGNSAEETGGGISLESGSQALLNGSRITGNSAGIEGGGVFVGAAAAGLSVSEDSIIQSNTPDNCAPEPLCPPLPSEPTLIDFDDPTPPGSSFSFLNGVFEGIDFGTNQWRWEGPYNVNPTNHIFFSSGAGQSRNFSFAEGPRILRRMQVFTPRSGTLTLSDDAGQSYSQFVPTGSLIEIDTDWSLPATTVTVHFTRGWDLGVDNIVFE
ncbi:MAG: right-handed parallel beta-helix repeat-containing protein [Gammaproteobacteria bacterium]|nr:right-handed parallel beta-helix repeat-containing protein [Gammaproteobacteria bacterium]